VRGGLAATANPNIEGRAKRPASLSAALSRLRLRAVSPSYRIGSTPTKIGTCFPVDDAARPVMVSNWNELRTSGAKNGPAVCGQDRGSRAGGFRKGRLCRVRTYGLADTGIPRPAWAEREPQSARLEGSGPLSGMRCSRPRCHIGQVGEVDGLIPVDRHMPTTATSSADRRTVTKRGSLGRFSRSSPPVDYLDKPQCDGGGSRFNRRNRAKWVRIQPALTRMLHTGALPIGR
jgi:hypothetical protein